MPPKLKCVLPDKLQKNESATRFFMRFELACKCLDWTEEATKASQVLLLLGNDAFDYACSLDDDTLKNYTELKKVMLAKWEGGDLPSEYARQFQQMKLKEGEDLTAFLTKMKKVVKLAYPDFEDAVREKMIMSQFTMAMPDEIQQLVYLSAEKPETSTKLVDLCEKFRKIKNPGKTTASCAKVELGDAKLDRVLERVEALSIEVAGLRERDEQASQRIATVRVGGQTGNFRGSCFKCGKWGHMARTCNQTKGPSQERVCELCNNPGHSKSSCALNGPKRCSKCGNLGHDASTCLYATKSLNES